LDEIAFVTGCRLQANVATEARVAQHLVRGYGVPIPARLANVLAGKTWLKPLTARPGRLPRPSTAAVDGGAMPPMTMGSFPVAVETSRPPAVEHVAPALGLAPAISAAASASAASSKPRAPDDSVTERVLRADAQALAPPLADIERPRTEA